MLKKLLYIYPLYGIRTAQLKDSSMELRTTLKIGESWTYENSGLLSLIILVDPRKKVRIEAPLLCQY